MRDSRIGIMGRNNGLVIKEKDGSASGTIRLGTETALKIGIEAIADHLERETESTQIDKLEFTAQHAVDVLSSLKTKHLQHVCIGHPDYETTEEAIESLIKSLSASINK